MIKYARAGSIRIYNQRYFTMFFHKVGWIAFLINLVGRTVSKGSSNENIFHA